MTLIIETPKFGREQEEPGQTYKLRDLHLLRLIEEKAQYNPLYGELNRMIPAAVEMLQSLGATVMVRGGELEDLVLLGSEGFEHEKRVTSILQELLWPDFYRKINDDFIPVLPNPDAYGVCGGTAKGHVLDLVFTGNEKVLEQFAEMFTQHYSEASEDNTIAIAEAFPPLSIAVKVLRPRRRLCAKMVKVEERPSLFQFRFGIEEDIIGIDPSIQPIGSELLPFGVKTVPWATVSITNWENPNNCRVFAANFDRVTALICPGSSDKDSFIVKPDFPRNIDFSPDTLDVLERVIFQLDRWKGLKRSIFNEMLSEVSFAMVELTARVVRKAARYNIPAFGRESLPRLRNLMGVIAHHWSDFSHPDDLLRIIETDLTTAHVWALVQQTKEGDALYSDVLIKATGLDKLVCFEQMGEPSIGVWRFKERTIEETEPMSTAEFYLQTLTTGSWTTPHSKYTIPLPIA